MGKWAKPSASLVDLFHEHLPRDPRIAHRRMFGFPCAAVHGNMLGGVFQEQIFLRLPPARREALEAQYGPTPFSPMEGRASKTYTRLPDDVVADEEALGALLTQALAHVAAMPAKDKKVRTPTKAGKGGVAR